MKKIISLVLALALVCGLAVNAVAANVGVSVDNDVIVAGETVTVTVTLDEEIPADTGVTSVQCVLGYDKSVLTYVDGAAGEGYGWLVIVPSNRNDEIKINSGTDFSLKTLPAGTVAVLSFTANETTTAASLNLSVSMTVGLQSGDSVEVPGASVAVTVCPGHNYVETKSEATCQEPATVTYVCEHCGDSYDGESDGVYGDHSLEYDWGTSATCDENGVKGHYYCTVCGKLFLNEDATEEVTAEDLVLVAAHVPYPSQEWMEDGTIVETVICGYCGEPMGESVVVNQLFSEDCPVTVNIAAGDAAHYIAYGFGGWQLTVTGENASVDVTVWDRWSGATLVTTYEAVNGVVTIPVANSQERITIYNNGSSDASYEISYIVPLGDWTNPEPLYDGENSVEIAADNYYGYFTSYTPYCNGTLTVTVNGEYWNFTINSYGDPEDYSDDKYGDRHSSMDVPAVNTESVEVVGGYPVEIVLSTEYTDESWNWYYPAGTLTVEIEFVPNHTVQHVDAVTPSCSEDGNIEYWYCSVCGSAWVNEELTQITNMMSVVLPAACQDVAHVEAKAPSCFEEGNIEYWYCTNPDHGTVWIDEALTQVSNHMSVKLAPWCQDVVHIEAVEPGCHYEGNVEYWYCTNPEHGTVWTDEDRTQVSNHLSVILPELGGDVIHVEAADASCTKDGHIEYWYCEVCDQVWQDEALTQLTNHKNVITDVAHGHIYDDDKDMICNVCEFDRTNSQTGDFTILVAAAAAVISATGIVALPVTKKKFF